MSAKMSKALVIDASVARSAGETTHPVSSACREALSTIHTVCHRMVMCKEIATEWKKHQSHWSARWLASMQSRGKIVRVNISDDGLAEKLEQLDTPGNGLKAMLKDLHLVQAARLTDQRIVSSDQAARVLFEAASVEVTELQPLLWKNPTLESDDCLKWLKAGARK